MQNIARYAYAKKFGGEEIEGNIKDEMVIVELLIRAGKIYNPEIKITQKFKQLLDLPIPKLLQKGFYAIVEFDGMWQDIRTFSKRESKLEKPILETAVVSHILSLN
jgi:hypothetical protein